MTNILSCAIIILAKIRAQIRHGQQKDIEVWLSLVERHVRDVEAVGSSPVTSTKLCKSEHLIFRKALLRICFDSKGSLISVRLPSFLWRVSAASTQGDVFPFLLCNEHQKGTIDVGEIVSL